MKIKVLYAVKIGLPDYMEQVITDSQDLTVQENAKSWALRNGFDRLRVAVVDLSEPPSFIKAIAK